MRPWLLWLWCGLIALITPSLWPSAVKLAANLRLRVTLVHLQLEELATAAAVDGVVDGAVLVLYEVDDRAAVREAARLLLHYPRRHRHRGQDDERECDEERAQHALRCDAAPHAPLWGRWRERKPTKSRAKNGYAAARRTTGLRADEGGVEFTDEHSLARKGLEEPGASCGAGRARAIQAQKTLIVVAGQVRLVILHGRAAHGTADWREAKWPDISFALL